MAYALLFLISFGLLFFLRHFDFGALANVCLRTALSQEQLIEIDTVIRAISNYASNNNKILHLFPFDWFDIGKKKVAILCIIFSIFK